MRLKQVECGHGPVERCKLRLMALLMGGQVPDVVKTLLYRPGLFGKSFHRFLQEVMRGPSAWSPGERELFAAFTSRLNACHF